MAKLSANFTEEEFTHSDTADKYGIPNNMNEFYRKIAVHTCQYLLEPLRALLNDYYKCKVIIKITSGYRSPELNKRVKGSNTSQHLKACAADMKFYKVIDGKKQQIKVIDVYNLVKKWVKEGKLSVDQCIYEVSGTSIWLHASHHPSGKSLDRRQFLNYKNGKYYLDY